MKKVTLLSFSLFLLLHVVAQTTVTYKGFTLAANPELHKVANEFTTESAVFVKDARKLELVPSPKGIDFYSSYHKIIRVNDEKGIENFNKIYIPVSSYMELVQIKARAITPGNKVIDVAPDAIKDYKDEDGEFKIFAVDGISKGTEIEYTYTVKRSPFFFGKEVVQSRFPVQESSVEIVSPATIKFEAKSFNIKTEPAEELDEEKNQRVIRFTAANVPSYTDEKYANVRPGLIQVQYKLSYTQNRGMNVRMFTWNELAKDVYDSYNQFSKKEKEVAKDLLKKTDIKTATTDEQKIKLIENYVKNNIKTGEDVDGEDFEDFNKIQRNKIATNKAISRLTCAMLQEVEVKYEVVVAADREEYLIERSFENWNHAQNLVLYFPAVKQYIAPSSYLFRYPFIPPSWAGTNGLYCVPVEVGEMKSAMAEVKAIPMMAASRSHHDLETELTFNKAGDTVFVNTKHIHSGYDAAYYKAQFIFLPPDEQKKFLKEMAKNSGKTENIISHELKNKELEITDEDKPFVVDLKLASVDLIENAGSKILLKVGECIGPQVEMYNERERQFDIEIDFPHFLNRKIVLNIPEGYKVKNPDDLKFNLSYSSGTKTTMAFISTWKQEGNKLIIDVTEQYNQIKWPKTDYDNFVKVINAAADFNKVVLVLEK
ncbi:DUF3857 domain-containing protein [Lacibacter luteus]|uniref:DUF3857 domain-containing protein n=1 Tax=Lacibacter luteus TaxID=2508719 RepID=A0A4V1M721_9BACT|nr:DUF3857 domain-containing protein [Lacibacter luteus]RXK57839.1 DUF3857 domain-containing protein [Lacibacter luteus]